MVVLGYLVSFLYMGLVIFVGELVQKKTGSDPEMTRKVEHVATSASWVIGYLLVGPTYHLIIINFLAFAVLTVITFSNFMQSVVRTDADKSYGLFYFGLSTFLTIVISYFLGETFIVYSGIAYYCLAVADGLAPITAKLFGKANIKVYEPKSLVGFLTVFVMSVAVAFVFNGIFSLGLETLFIFSLGSVAAHAELYGRKGIDNLLVNFLVFVYIVLNHHGLVTDEFQIAALLVMIFTPFAASTKSLTFYGGASSIIYLALSAFFGDPSLVVMIFGLFFIEAIVSKVTTKIFNQRSEQVNKLLLTNSKVTTKIFNQRSGAIKEKHSRGMVQILANGLAPLVCTVLYHFTKNQVFLFGAIVSLAEEFSDSVASDVGRLSGKPPRDILTLKRIDAGISGGVSFLGLVSALLASFMAVAIGYAFGVMDLWHYLILSALAFGGTIIDSLLGSSIQVLYKCPVCNMFTENKTHCDSDAVKVKGLTLIDNSTVNLLSGVIIALVTIGLSLVI